MDIALSLAREGLGANTVFYLIQNKYDDNDNNRPAQLPYDKGELGQRNKLARLLMRAAPGARAYSLNDWTPFGFKAGGLVGMDLVYEESLNLTNMLVLDRNANAHNLEAVMADLKLALSDPGRRDCHSPAQHRPTRLPRSARARSWWRRVWAR